MSTTPEALASTPDAPVVPAPAPPDGTELETGNEAAPSPAATANESDSSAPESKWVQRRIDELTKLRHDAERRERDAAKERDHWREQAMREQKPAAKPEAPTKPKTLADFGFDEGQYHGYLLGEASKAATEAAKTELRQEQERAERQRQVETYVTRVQKFAKDHPDYKDVAEGAPISDKVAEIIVGLEEGPEVAYHLGKNPELATQISRLSERHAAFELGQIAARLGFEREKAAAAKKIISTAPPPPPQIGTTNQVVEKDPKEMTQPEFNKWRRKQISARKGWSANQ